MNTNDIVAIVAIVLALGAAAAVALWAVVQTVKAVALVGKAIWAIPSWFFGTGTGRVAALAIGVGGTCLSPVAECLGGGGVVSHAGIPLDKFAICVGKALFKQEVEDPIDEAKKSLTAFESEVQPPGRKRRGRSGRQRKLKAVALDPHTPKCVKGEMLTRRGQKGYFCIPGNQRRAKKNLWGEDGVRLKGNSYELAHGRAKGKRARDGCPYDDPSCRLQLSSLHAQETSAERRMRGARARKVGEEIELPRKGVEK